MAQHNQQQRGRPVAVVNRAAEAVRINEFRVALLSKADDFTRALAGLIDPQKFIDIALTMIATIKDADMREKVLECSPDSLVVAVLQAAQVGLRMDGQQATVIPYAKQAQFTPMVKGRIDLILRSRGVVKVVSRTVREGDDFRYVLGTDEKIEHVPSLDPKPGAPISHAYAVVTFENGTTVFEVVGRERIEQVRTQFSKVPNGPAWSKSYGQMAEKVALNRVTRLIDTDPDVAGAIRQAIEAEFEIPDHEDVVTERVAAQVADARAKIEQLTKGAPPAAPKVPTTAELLEEIRLEADRQELDDDQAAQEAAHALAGVECPRDGKGTPIPSRLSVEQLQRILEHFRALGPGFGGDGPAGGGGAPAGDTGAEAGTGGQEAPPVAGGAPGATGAPAAARRPDPPKVDPLGARRMGQGAGSVHLVDPLVKTDRANPPVCIGCGSKVGGQQGGAGFVPASSTERELYCARALTMAETYPEERVPEAILGVLVREAEGA